ncbi:MAG: UPF0175 family protein [Acidobacteriota bacterium]
MTIPDRIAGQLAPNGGDVSRLALESLAVEGYRRQALNLGEVAELLECSVYDAHGILKGRGVEGFITAEEIEQQRAALEALIGK